MVDPIPPDEWTALRRRQEGVVSRAQLLAWGVTPATIAAQLAAGRWQRPIPGIYVTFTGPLLALTKYWVALLHAGAGAILSHHTAGALWQLVPDQRSRPVDVLIPARRTTKSRRGLVIHRTRTVAEPVGSPPRTGVCRTALDLCVVAEQPTAIAAILGRLAQRYPRAPGDLRRIVADARSLPRKADILAILDDVRGGVHSALEWHYLVDVERAHGLPVGERQRPVGGKFQDIHHREYRTTVELDGRAVHRGPDARLRDTARDNLAAVRGETTLRYSWHDVRRRPCAVAAEVSTVLRGHGWKGVPQRCGPGCRS